MKLRTWLAGVVIGFAVVLGATAASAQTDPYSRRPPEVQGIEETRQPAAAPQAEVARRGDVLSAGLAVTGGDVAGLAALGVGLTLAGVVLVRRSRSVATA